MQGREAVYDGKEARDQLCGAADDLSLHSWRSSQRQRDAVVRRRRSVGLEQRSQKIGMRNKESADFVEKK